ncbi:hypothetical protein [Paraflavitalea speifideaquila]|nr:hypothetical protein [Paraflavitalea speifideiaquila]
MNTTFKTLLLATAVVSLAGYTGYTQSKIDGGLKNWPKGASPLEVGKK